MKNVSIKMACFLSFLLTFATSIPIWAQNHMDVSPNMWDFGDVEIGITSTATFTITNVDGADIIITKIALEELNGSTWDTATDNSFWIDVDTPVPAPPILLPIGDFYDVDIDFSPLSLGDHEVYLHIDGNAIDGDVRRHLVGAGTNPAVPEPSTMLLFGSGLLGFVVVTRKRGKRGKG